MPAFRMAITRRKDGDKFLVVMVPHVQSIFLPNGIQYYVDDKLIVTYPVTNCNENGCFLQKILDPRIEKAFSRGNQAIFRIALMSGKNLDVSFSLRGFTAAMQDLTKNGPVHLPGEEK